MNIAAPVPALAFTVGIVGHRADRIADAGAVRARIGELMRAVDAALDGIAGEGRHDGRQPLRLVSALAEGADRLAASEAVDAGMVLDAVLPFPAGEYLRDFGDDASKAEFQTLLGRAASVLVLDGAADSRAKAYEAAGMALLDNCDLLIAVWDGGPARGRGGTREVIEEAVRRAMPVLVVPPDGRAASIRSPGAASRLIRLEDVAHEPLDNVSTLVGNIVGGAGDPESEADWRALADLPPEPLVHGAYPLLLRAAGVAPRKRKAPPRQAPAAPEPRSPLAEAFAWWDAAAIRGAQAFRSAVIVNFGLASLAIVLAASSVLAGDLKWLFVAAEVAVILSLLANAWHARRRRWQERWLESREVAELLRVASMLRSVGVGRGLAASAGGRWSGWYAAALARASAPRSADLSDPAVAAPLVAEVSGQAEWNASTARRMHLAARRIERFGEILFVAVLTAAIGWLILFLAAPALAHDLGYPLAAITAGLPAIATASYGIRVILDFEGTGERAQRIASGLKALLEYRDEAPSSVAALQDFARRSADIMLGDVAAWRLLAEARRLAIPG